MQRDTDKAAEDIASAIGASIRTHIHTQECEFELTDYDVSTDARIEFETHDGVELANIILFGESSDVMLTVNKAGALKLSNVFNDLARDIERRE